MVRNLKQETEALSLAIHEQAIRMKLIKAKMDNFI